MAQGKNSFLLYTDHKELWLKVSDDQAGKLIKMILRYVTDENPQAPDEMTDLLFLQFKQHLKRDLKKWENYKQKQSENGKKGGRPKKAKETQKTQPFLEKAKKADNVNVNVNVLSNDNRAFDADFYKSEISKPENQAWRESWYMKFKVKPNSLALVIDKFNIHLGLKDQSELPKNLKEYKQHFYNWCNVQERFDGFAEYKKGKKQGAL